MSTKWFYRNIQTCHLYHIGVLGEAFGGRLSFVSFLGNEAKIVKAVVEVVASLSNWKVAFSVQRPLRNTNATFSDESIYHSNLRKS